MISEKGSATVETLVAALVAIPLFIAVPLLGKQLDAKHKTSMAARYAAWERTVWSDPGSSWRNGERSKSDADISLEINDRFYGHRSAVLVDENRSRSEGITSEPLWRDRSSRSLLANAGEGLPGIGTVDEGAASASHGVMVTKLAGTGISTILPDSLDKSIGLNTGNYVTTHVELPWEAEYPKEIRVNSTLSADAAILSDAWSPSDEERFSRRVDGLTVDEEISLLEAFGTKTFGALYPYREGKYGQDPDLEPISSVVPSRFIKDSDR